MNRKRSAQLAVLACVAWASLWLVALPTAASAKAKQKTALFSQCVDAAVDIPDGPPPPFTALNPAASFALFVPVHKFKGRPQSGRVTSIGSVGVRITHTDDSDLALFLVSPGGRAVALATYRDQSTNPNPKPPPDFLPSGDGYGSGAPNCSGNRVDFGDGFATSIATPGNTGIDAPIVGSFTPEQPLSTFVGGPARGFWTLIVQDIQFRDVGQINALALNFTYTYKAKKKKKRR